MHVMRYEPRTMAKKILLVVAAVIVVFVIVVATRPATFEVKRTAQINAPAEVVFAQVNDFKAWSAWSPWEQLDPTMKRTFNDVPAGVGAAYHWASDKDDVGEGNMKITVARPAEHLDIDLDFLEPFEAHNRIDFDFVKATEGTSVTWKMSGNNNFMAKVMGLFMDMDKMVGPDFEKGLASLKTVSEVAAKRAADEKAAADKAADDAAADASDAGVDAGTP